jgi:hypothetical protein
MALKSKLTAEAYATLAPALQGEYKLVGTDYVLDVEGQEDVGELKRAKDREVQAAKEAKAAEKKAKDELASLQATLGTDEESRARKAGDIAMLEKSWQGKLDAVKSDGEAKLSKREAFIQASLVDSVAAQIAARISKSPAVMLPHIRARLAADLSGDVPVTRVLDAAGKVSALSVAELEKEFVSHPDFSAIIVASNGSGGGAPGGRQTGSGAPKKFAEMTGDERYAFKQSDPTGYGRESAAIRSSGPQI